VHVVRFVNGMVRCHRGIEVTRGQPMSHRSAGTRPAGAALSWRGIACSCSVIAPPARGRRGRRYPLSSIRTSVKFCRWPSRRVKCDERLR
jgi:hypothetical protein